MSGSVPPGDAACRYYMQTGMLHSAAFHDVPLSSIYMMESEAQTVLLVGDFATDEGPIVLTPDSVLSYASIAEIPSEVW